MCRLTHTHACVNYVIVILAKFHNFHDDRVLGDFKLSQNYCMIFFSVNDMITGTL